MLAVQELVSYDVYFLQSLSVDIYEDVCTIKDRLDNGSNALWLTHTTVISSQIVEEDAASRLACDVSVRVTWFLNRVTSSSTCVKLMLSTEDMRFSLHYREQENAQRKTRTPTLFAGWDVTGWRSDHISV